MSEETVQLNVKGLDQLIKMMKANPVVAKLGILADKNSRTGGKNTNAEIGAKHEFGTDGMPKRSFLRMPLSEYLQGYLDKSGAFDEATLKKVVKLGTVVPWLQKVAVIAENVVQDAFSTGGFGAWKPSRMEYKKVQLTLVETQQLRNSISSSVEGGGGAA